MLSFRTGDILSSTADALVNPVNCVGVMGAGLAARFKAAWPENYRAYADACRRGEVQPGRLFTFETGQPTPPRFVVNLPTKRHWRDRSRLPDVVAGLAALVMEVRARQIRSLAIPALGAGLGRLAWADVKSSIEKAMAGLPDVEVLVFEPIEARPAGGPEEAWEGDASSGG